MSVINHVKEIRTEKHLNQCDLAVAVGADRKTIGYIERGERCPSVEIALRLAAYLKVDVSELFVLED